MKPQVFHALTFTRFIAAMGVLVFHYGQSCSLSLSDVLYRVASAGFIGVPFFFVLSGYVLEYTNKVSSLNTFRVADFYRSRFARIYPMYLVSFCIVVGLEYQRIGIAFLSFDRVFYYGLYLLGLQAWSDQTAFVLNGPAWSISVELFFYLMFPLIRPLSLRGKVTALMAYVGAGALAAIAVRVFAPAIPLKSLVGWSNPLLWLPLFCFGVILADCGNDPRNNRFIKLGWMFWPVLGATVACLLVLTLGGWFRTSTLGFCYLMSVPCGILIIMIPKSTALQSLFDKPIPRFLGAASYSVYLLHRLIADSWTVWSKSGPALSCAVFAPYCVVVVAIAGIGYATIEAPARMLLKARSRAKLREASLEVAV